MRTASSLILLFLAAACRHTPPDRDARAVAPPPKERHTPTSEELAGLWQSRAIRGAFADLGSFAVYVFGPTGRYTGAIAGNAESTPLEGEWTYADGVLTLDGRLELQALIVGDRLQLTGPDAFLELVRPAASRTTGSAPPATVRPDPVVRNRR